VISPRPARGLLQPLSLSIVPLLMVLLARPALAEPLVSAAPQADYVYLMQPHDTLIAVSRRLLKNPDRWRELRTRNGVADPRRMRNNAVLLIPRDWLRQSIEPAQVTQLVGGAQSAAAPIKVGDILGEGADLHTDAGSHVTIKLADGSVVVVGESSTVHLERLKRYDGTGARDTGVKLDRGSIDTHVSHQGGAGRFEIRTPVAISAVRGTEFRRAFSDDNKAIDRTEVTGGAVDVGGAASAGAASRHVAVAAGFGTLSDAVNGPRAPVKLLGPPDLSQLPERFEDAILTLNFAPVAQAQSYRAQIARDAEFHEIFSEQLSAAPAISFTGIAAGSYWLRVRSVDHDGLEGVDAVHAFELQPLPPAPSLLEPVNGDTVLANSTVFHWAAVATATNYQLQVARDASFQQTVADTREPATNTFVIESLPVASFFWRVAAIDAKGVRGHWSGPSHYSQRLPPRPLSAPTLAARSIELKWTGEPGQRYLVQLAADAEFHRVLEEQRVEQPAALLTKQRPGSYYVRVRATDADGYVGPFTPARRFVVPLPWWAIAAPVVLGLSLL
jgi:hypothetical protein